MAKILTHGVCDDRSAWLALCAAAREWLLGGADRKLDQRWEVAHECLLHRAIPEHRTAARLARLVVGVYYHEYCLLRFGMSERPLPAADASGNPLPTPLGTSVCLEA